MEPIHCLSSPGLYENAPSLHPPWTNVGVHLVDVSRGGCGPRTQHAAVTACIVSEQLAGRVCSSVLEPGAGVRLGLRGVILIAQLGRLGSEDLSGPVADG